MRDVPDTKFVRICREREALHEAVVTGYAQGKLLLDLGKFVKGCGKCARELSADPAKRSGRKTGAVDGGQTA
jgi:hypothetical protein